MRHVLAERKDFILIYGHLGCHLFVHLGICHIPKLGLGRTTKEIQVWGKAAGGLMCRLSHLVELLAGCILSLLLGSFLLAKSNQPFIDTSGSDWLTESDVTHILIGLKISLWLFILLSCLSWKWVHGAGWISVYLFHMSSRCWGDHFRLGYWKVGLILTGFWPL